jgi:putative nucleotidyltransferase with HDIG domain
LEHLPTLPSVAAQVLALSLDASESAEGMAALISTDPCLTAEILRAANSPELGAETSCLKVSEAVERLGTGLVHSTVLSIALSTVTSSATGVPAADRGFWMHCVATGVCAELIATRIGSRHKANAFVAGLLHDIGKIVLDLVDPESYARAVDTALTHDLFILEAERRELGSDHTLIGKWLAESWELPHIFTDVIWLHHHPPGTLDATQYPVELIEVVTLADSLAHECLRSSRGRREPVSNEQLERLGLRRNDLDALRNEAAPAVRERLRGMQDAFDEDRSGEALQKATRELLMAGARFDGQAKGMRQEVQHLRAIAEMSARLRSGQSLREVLDIIIDAARRGMGIGVGACFVADARERMVLAKWWRSPEDRPKELMHDLERESSGALTQFDPSFLRAAGDAVFARNAQGWAGANLTALSRREGFLVVPLRGEGRTVGQLVIEKPVLNGVPEDMKTLETFAEACGSAVARQRAEENLLERTEDLAAALWRKELAYKKGLQAERLNAEANVAAGAAHALNRYLSEIAINAQLMLHRRQPGEESSALESIVEQSRNAHKMVEDLISFARTPLPKLEATLIQFILHQAVSQCQENLQAKGIRLVERYAEGLPRVLVDRHQLIQCFRELIRNAEDALGSRGGIITVETVAAPDRHSVSIVVSDNGPGLTPSIRERMFEPFFTTHESEGRLGLGLALCQRIVEKHRGTLDVESCEGEGTRMVLTFPSTVHLTAQRAKEAPVVADEAAVDGPCILVVDDEEQLCRALKEHLEHRGYRVLTAGDGIDALRMIATSAIDLVLLDMRMPTRDGLSVLGELHERFSSLPVIVMTGLATQEEVEDALRLGARSCLSKPIEIGHLLGEIDNVLSSRRDSV